MNPSPPEVLLTVNGQSYGDWTDIVIDRDMEAGAGKFSLRCADRFPGQEAKYQIQAGAECVLTIDGETAIDGYVDEAGPEYDKQTHEIVVEGRDKVGDLVDCSAAVTPNEYKDQTLLQIAQALAQPFGIQVSAQAAVGAPFSPFRIHVGETVWEAIDRMARHRGVLPVSDGKGGLVFQTAGQNGTRAAIALGQNILGANGRNSWKNRFSKYIVLAQGPGAADVSPEESAGTRGEATDPGITRYRPLVIIAEQPEIASGLAQQRAQWEATVRAGRGVRATITVQGWRDSGGQLWIPNVTVPVTDEFQGLDNVTMLASRAKLILNEERGFVAELGITLPTAFTPQPMGEYTDWPL